jgi:hypothetical protein
MNWNNTLSLMKIIAKELLSETRPDKETKEQNGGLSSKICETSTMWKISHISSI